MFQDPMLGEDMEYKKSGKLYHGKCVVSQNEDALFGYVINNDEDGCIARRGWKLYYEIHGYGVPRSHGDGEWFKEAIEFVPMGLAPSTDCARVAVVFDKVPHAWPGILPSD